MYRHPKIVVTSRISLNPPPDIDPTKATLAYGRLALPRLVSCSMLINLSCLGIFIQKPIEGSYLRTYVIVGLFLNGGVDIC